MEEKSEGYNHYSTNGGSVTGVVGYIFLFIFKFNTRLTFVEGAETGSGLASTDVGGVTGVAGPLGCSSCRNRGVRSIPIFKILISNSPKMN